MNEPEKIDPRELSPLALAFVGDSVLELLVRQRLVHAVAQLELGAYGKACQQRQGGRTKFSGKNPMPHCRP